MQKFEVTVSKIGNLVGRLIASLEQTRRHLAWLAISFGIVVTITAVQYLRYGTERYLGWDTPNYVYLTVLMDQFGPATMYQQWYYYPHLYVSILWVIGKALGNVGVADRLLAFFWLFVLLVAYQRISWHLTKSLWLSGLTVLFASVNINTIRIFADLHRALMALSLSLLVILLVAKQASSLLRLTRANLLLVGLMVAVLATEIEQYAVLASTLVLSTFFRRDLRQSWETVIFCSIPVVLLSPSLIGLLLQYPANIAVLERESISIDWYTTLLFGTGSLFTLPFIALGIAYMFNLVKKGNRLAQLVAAWLLTVGGITVALALGIAWLPPVRALYLVPVPLLLAFSLPGVEWLGQRRRR